MLIDFVKGKNVESFNAFLKSNFENVGSIIHDEKSGEVKIDGQFEVGEILQIEKFYNDLPTYTQTEIAKRGLKDRINELRNIIATTVFEHEIDGVLHLFDCDDRSAIRLTALIQAATFHLSNGLPFVQAWRCADNETVLLDAQQAIELFTSGRDHESATVFKAVYIKDTIDATNYSSVEEIEKIDALKLWEATPWPQV
jgi:hypothetical protein